MVGRTTRWAWLAAGLAAVGAAATGCQGGIRKVPAAGTVTLDGKPLDEGVLLFFPDPSKGNDVRVSCFAKIGKDGKFKLATSGIVDKDSGSGIPPGWYKVALNNEDDPRAREDPKFRPKVVIPNRYYDATKTPLAVEVVDDPPPGHYDLKLESK